ncbi:cytochrome c [Chryseolinea sp. H1M3-3]|uniref:cytochrome c4 n=1 Tax=Chryseolinea sp. H1M3-3 TaxID=3034144 RepID=UPI0023EBC143|nr:cytochrome c [Chryseolinea sp. H1M3-3]
MKILKWIGYALLTILLLATAFYIKAYVSTENRLSKKYNYTLQPFEVKTDSAIVAEGHRILKTKGCKSCHGEDLAGKVWLDDAMLGRIVTPNLTKGKGGLPKDYSTHDWLRSLKHGLKRDSTPLRIMPSHEISHLGEEDMNALIAYLSQLQPVDHELPETSLGVLAYVLTDLDQILLIPADSIDHSRPLTKGVSREVSVKFGEYLSANCSGCHRKNMKGGPPLAPGFPVVADISSTGNPGKWSEEQFINTLKTGTTPEGKKLKAEEMPWIAFKNYNETEMKALYLFLKSM